MAEIDIETLLALLRQSIGIEAAEKFINEAIEKVGLYRKTSYAEGEFKKICEALKKKGGYVKIAATVASRSAYRDIYYQEIIAKERKEKEDLARWSNILEQKVKERTKELKEAQDQLIQAEKLNAVGQLASGVAHEVKNPLGIIIQGVNYLEKKISPKKKDIFETLTIVKDSVERANRIITSLLDFSKITKLDLQPQDINSILEDSLSLIKQGLKFEHIEIIKETKKDIPKVLVDKNKMEQVFINILLNAIQAIPKRGKITIRSYDTQLKEVKNGIGRRKEDHFKLEEKAVLVEVEDTGIGITEENLKKVFDPFFTTKDLHGAGLGLSVSRNIISMHKGLIDVKSQIGKGTKVTVALKITER